MGRPISPSRLLAGKLVLFFVIYLLITVLATAYRDSIDFQGIAQSTFPGASFLGSLVNFDAFLASMWANLLFFLLVGLATAVITLKNPSEDQFEQRLWYLYSANHATAGVWRYLQERTRKLAATTESARSRYVIAKTGGNSKPGFYVHLDHEFRVRNHLARETALDETVPFWCQPDDVGCDPIGTVTCLQLQSDDSSVPEDRLGVNLVDIPASTKVFNRSEKLTIPGGGRMTSRFKYSCWIAKGVTWRQVYYRYTEGVSIEIANQTPTDLKVSWTISPPVTGQNSSGQIALRPGDEAKIPLKQTFMPDEAIEIEFS